MKTRKQKKKNTKKTKFYRLFLYNLLKIKFNVTWEIEFRKKKVKQKKIWLYFTWLLIYKWSVKLNKLKKKFS